LVHASFRITVFAVRDLVSVSPQFRCASVWSGRFWRKAEGVTSTILVAIVRISPIEMHRSLCERRGNWAGYSYFAPGVPDSHKLVPSCITPMVESNTMFLTLLERRQVIASRRLDMLQQFHYAPARRDSETPGLRRLAEAP
jgi:hypothetical protein